MKLWRYGCPIEELGQRYRLDGMLGSGGMADVCLAWDEHEGREAAVKILKPDDLDQETLNRFMKEAAQIAGWQHPNILHIYESIQVELIDPVQGSVLFYMVTEYARGGDLQKRLAPGKPFPLSASFALFRQLCGAVQYAHEQGIIHRDLKPLNILFRRPATGPEEVVLSDFGLAVQMDASHHTFARGGTLAYMAPEQFQGNALPASDIFALGVIIYQLCTGHLPFRRAIQDLPRLLNTPAPLPMRPSLLNPELPAALDEVLLKSLHELPSERYRSAQELWDAIVLALVAVAPTFAGERDVWYAAGQTWPMGNSEQSHASLTSSDNSQSRDLPDAAMPSHSLPVERMTSTEEGPVSELGSVREKQKASPDMGPGISLPNHSIHRPPNQSGQFARHFAAPHPAVPEGDQQASGKLQTPPGQQRSGDDDIRAGQRRHPLSRDLPATSASGSTTLSGLPRASSMRPRSSAKRLNAIGEAAPLVSRAPRSDTDASPVTRARATARSRPDDENISSRKTAVPISPEHTSKRSQPILFTDARSGASSTGTGDQQSRGRIAARISAASVPSTVGSRLAPQVARRKHLRLPRGSRLPWVPTLTTLALLVLLVAIFLAASAQTPLLHLLNAPVTTVTLTPRSQIVEQNLTLTAAPNPTTSQVQVRTLTATSPTQSTTANASGSIQGKRATGQLTFINNGSTPITIQRTTISDHNGIQVSFDGPITIPAVPPSSAIVTGFAVNAGAAGNIPVLDIVGPCCATNIVVKNTTAFTGGQDAQPNSVIAQKDIDGAVNGLGVTLKPGVLNSLQGQVRANERVIASSQQCQPQVNADRRAGDVAKSVTVQVALMCSEQVYNDAAAQQIARATMQRSINSNPSLGAAFALDGPLALNILNVTPNGANNTFALNVQARGLWVYSFSQNSLRQLVAQIAGKSEAEASALLQQQTGIVAVQFSASGTLPVNTGEIRLVVKQLPSVEAAPTPA